MTNKAPPSSQTSDAEPPDEELVTRECHEDLVHELMGVIDKRVNYDAEEELKNPFEAVSLLRDAVRERASDIHLDTQVEGVLVRLRIDGAVLDGALLDHPIGKRLCNQMKVMCGLDPVAKYLPEEGRSSYEVDGSLLDLRMAHGTCPLLEWRQDQRAHSRPEAGSPHFDAIGFAVKSAGEYTELA